MSDDRIREVVARLREQGTDDAEVEVKASATRLSKGIWDSVSAFANTAGGLVILGLSEEDGFTPVPDFAIDIVRDAFVDGMGDGNVDGARLGEPPAYDIARAKVDGRPVLTIRIHENAPGAKPCYVKAKGVAAGSYKRVDDKDIRLSATEIYELQNQLRPSQADRDVVAEARREDLRDDLVEVLVHSPRSAKAVSGVDDPFDRLRSLNVLTGDGDVRMAAVLTLARYPQQFFPRLLVDVAVHPGLEKSAPESPVRFVDRRECEGPVIEVVDEAVDVLRRNLRTQSVVDGIGRRDVLELPEEVLREAVVNALLHREYDPRFVGQPVGVDVYPDRVEVTSPGGFWGGKDPINLDDGTSRCRNQGLLQMLERVPLGGDRGVLVEGNGSGVPLMNRLMAARGLPEPDFTHSTLDQVRVILRRPDFDGHAATGASAAAAGRGRGRVLGREAPLASSPPTYEPTGLNRIVRDAVPVGEPVSIQEIAAATGRTPNALRAPLRQLIDEGYLAPTAPPRSRNRRYVRVPSP